MPRAQALRRTIDYTFTTPKYQVTAVQLSNNGGGNTFDADGMAAALVEVFDASGGLLFSGTLDAGNGFDPFNTVLPAPLDNVSRVRLSNMTNLLPFPGGAPDILWREFSALQNVASPTIATTITSDGFSDDVTVAATEGLDGTLTWTLYGPVSTGPSGTCSDATWAGAPVFASGTVPIPGDGTYTTTPGAPPPADGCYSYGDVLSSLYYAADVVSAVGQPSETFAVPLSPPTTTTTTTTTVVPPTTDPCAPTTTSTSTTSTSTSTSTTTTTTPASLVSESSAPLSATQDSSTEESSTTASSTTASATTTSSTTTLPSASTSSLASSGPMGFGRAPAQVPDPCAPTTTVVPTTVATTVPAVTSGGGAVPAGGGSGGGALPVTGPQPAGPIAAVAALLVVLGAGLIIVLRQRQ